MIWDAQLCVSFYHYDKIPVISLSIQDEDRGSIYFGSWFQAMVGCRHCFRSMPRPYITVVEHSCSLHGSWGADREREEGSSSHYIPFKDTLQ
jgi:hypothetical protein